MAAVKINRTGVIPVAGVGDQGNGNEIQKSRVKNHNINQRAFFC